jgi:hypothetical protein
MPPETPSRMCDDTQRVRRLLGRLRSVWGRHSPSKPLFLGEELEPGVTVAQFCESFMVSQRSRRVVRTAKAREEGASEERAAS